MVTGWSDEVVQELRRRHLAEAVPWIEQRTVVVCEWNGGDPVPNFTAVLVRVADRPFAITAAHCLKGWKEGTRFLIMLPNQDFVDLTTVQAETPKDKSMDFALLPLTHEMASKLSSFRSFVRLSEIDVAAGEPPAGIHAVLGYPIKLRERPADGWLSTAIFYPTQLTTARDRNPDTTIALFLDDEHEDENGDRSRLPELQGISGCGVWRLHRKGDDPTTWSVDRITLVGIEYGFIKGAILGVRARYVIGGIAMQFPELEPCVELVGIRIVRPRP
jgi:hypothetical protein